MRDSACHPDWNERLIAYAAGTLPRTERAGLHAHLAACPTCRAALAEWQALAGAVRAEAVSRLDSHRTAHGSRLPELTLPPREPVQHPQLAPSRNGHGLNGAMPTTEHQSQEKSTMTAHTMFPTPARTQVRRQPALTLFAALLLAAMFAAVLLAYSQQSDSDPGEQVVPSAGLQTASQTPLAPDSTQLGGIQHEMQEWNNSGPATLAMALSYWGWTGRQQDIAQWVKPNSEDKWATPWQLVAYVDAQTSYGAVYNIGGSLPLLKRLLSGGFPVIIELGFELEGEGWMNHYVLAMGFDDDGGHILTYDSYLGSNQDEGRPIPYDDFEARWQQANYSFTVVYALGQEQPLSMALAEYGHPGTGATTAYSAALAALESNPKDSWAWLARGLASVWRNDFEQAVLAFDQAFYLGLPWRITWYHPEIYAAYFELGRYADVLDKAAATLDTTPYVEEPYYWQALAHSALGDTSAAQQALTQLVDLNPNFLFAERYRLVDHLPAVEWTSPTFQPTVIPPSVTPTATLIPPLTLTPSAVPSLTATATATLTPTRIP